MSLTDTVAIMIRLVAMDMAGTTIEEGGAVYTALSEAVAQSIGRVVPEHVTRNWMGADKHEAILGMHKALGQDLDTSQVETVYEQFAKLLDQAYVETPPAPLPGVEAAFRAMRAVGCRVFLTSGFSETVAFGILDSLGWTVSQASALDGVVTADMVGAGRPQPLMIQRCMELANITDPNDVAVAGDTVLDVEAGLAAKARIVAGVLTGAQDRDTLATASPTHVLDSVVDLAELIREINTAT